MTGDMIRAPVRQQGVAVITAMLVVAIATVLAVQLLWETSLDLRRTEDLLVRGQAIQYALGAEAFASDELRKYLERQGGQSTGQLPEPFIFPIEGGTIEATVEDLQGRFNLNSLVAADGKHDAVAIRQFERLLDSIEVIENPHDLALAIADWIDSRDSPELDVAEDDTYTSLIPAYRAANFWFTSASELMAVAGVTPEIYAELAPLVAPLPPAGLSIKINLNTARPPVIQSLGEDISKEDAETWFEDHRLNPEEQCTDPTLLPFQIEEALLPYTGCASTHFALRANVTIGTTRVCLYSLLQQNGLVVVPRLRSFLCDVT